MADLFDGYPLGERLGRDVRRARPSRGPRTPGSSRRCSRSAGEELAARADLLSQTYRDAGVTFAHAGEEQPFPLDIVPRVIGADEWDGHRARGRPAGARAGGVPRRRLRRRASASPTGSCRAASSPPARTSTARRTGWCRPNGVRVHVSGIDLVRDEAGDFRVLEDNLRSPSGVSYVITNRAAMSQVLPELFADHRIQPVADYPSRLLAALQGLGAVERAPTRRSSSSPPASTTPRTSSTRCWPGRWASSSWRAATWSAPATR